MYRTLDSLGTREPPSSGRASSAPGSSQAGNQAACWAVPCRAGPLSLRRSSGTSLADLWVSGTSPWSERRASGWGRRERKGAGSARV